MNKTFQLSFRTTLSRPYQVCLIILTVLIIYYPAIFAEISILDDREAITSLFNLQSFDLNAMFFPRAKEGGYYRPFLGVSYLIDRFWWFLDPKIMHFENILMHLINSLLVFRVGIRLCKRQEVLNSLMPLGAALLFALHPINTESINWISGRTDPMACTFVLLALLFVLNYIEKKNLLNLLLAFVMTLFGIFSKETAFGFLLGAIFILMAEKNDRQQLVNESLFVSPIVALCYTSLAFLSALLFSNFYAVIIIGFIFWFHISLSGSKSSLNTGYARKMLTLLLVLLSCVVIILLFYALRKIAYVSDTSKVSSTLKVMLSDFNYSIELFIGAAGFYVKKFLVPTPLNLAIREIDPLYELFGVVCFMACIILIYLRRLYSSLILAGFMLLSPVFLFVFGTFAWTGYAERYCYIPSAFWILGCLSYIDTYNLPAVMRRYAWIIFAVVALYFAGSTFQRNLLWLTNIDIIKDTVEKTPDFKNIRGLYMSALVEKKDFAEAERQYLAAKKIKTLAYDERYDLMYATILLNQKRYSEAEDVYAEVESITKGKSEELYQALIAYHDSRMYEKRDPDSVLRHRKMKITAYEKLYALNNSPVTSYRLGQVYLSDGNKVKALQAIRFAVEHFRSDEPLKKNAETLLKNIDSAQ